MNTVIPFRTIEISRAKLEAAIETLVEILDQIDAPGEGMEPDNDDMCTAGEDDFAARFGDGAPGDHDDAEDNHDRELVV